MFYYKRISEEVNDYFYDASPEDLRAVHAMLLALKRKEQHDE